jgi:hypothetical protein
MEIYIEEGCSRHNIYESSTTNSVTLFHRLTLGVNRKRFRNVQQKILKPSMKGIHLVIRLMKYANLCYLRMYDVTC